MTWTYDPLTVRGRVRWWSRDLDSENPIFTDAEIDASLLDGGFSGSPTDTYDGSQFKVILWSAALAFLGSIGDAAKEATISKIAIFSDNTKVTADAMRDYATDLQNRALSHTAGDVTPTYGVDWANTNPLGPPSVAQDDQSRVNPLQDW